MRVGLVRKIGFTLVALGVVGLGGCNDDPLDFDEQTAVRMFTNPSFMVVQTGDSVQFVANGINAGNEPTFQAVTATVASCGGSGSISVIESDQQTSIQPPQIYEVIGGAALGGACVVVQSGSVTDTVDVVVVGGTLNVTAAPTLIIAGSTGDVVVVELVGVDGTPVTPFDPTDVAWSSDNSAVLTVDDVGNIASPGPSGSATISATWTGTDATGTSGQGVSLVATAPVTVKPDVPVAAAFDTIPFGAVSAGGLSAVAVLVTDQFGNQVTDSTQVLSIAVMSDNEPAATVSDNFSPDALASLSVTATGVAAGVANISGTVTTSEGVFAYGPGPVFVLDPIIVSAAAGAPTSFQLITGTGLAQAGFTTTVIVDGNCLAGPSVLGNFTVDSDTQITAQMPSCGTAGDFDVIVDVGGIPSATAAGIWTQTVAFSDATTEPANDVAGAGPIISVPFSYSGQILFASGEPDDFFLVTLSSAATVVMDLDWAPQSEDLDILAVDAGFTAFICTDGGAFGGGTFEHSDCAFPAGTSQAWIAGGFGGPVDSNYNLTGTIQP